VTATAAGGRRDLASLPKAHLHLHFEEGIRQQTLDEFAAHAAVPTPRMKGFRDFEEFDHLAQAAARVMRTPDQLARMVLEIAEDAATQGCTWIEPGVWLPLHRARIGPDEQTLEILVDAARGATAATGVGIGWLIAANRNDPPQDAVEQARLAAHWAGRGVVSFGLHNDENRFPPEVFAEAFRIAADAGLALTPHGGEFAGPESVRACVEVFGADRVQHGIHAAADPALLDLLRERGVCLDVCPTSNVVLGAVESLAVHPLPRLLGAGVACSVNADNPVMFDCTIVSEYELCRSAFGLSDAELAGIARASVRGSAAPADRAKAALTGIDAWLAGATDGLIKAR
jgi:adenosine deaminase